jgi:thiosulfate/3-mercaptopyruvate sulfurtransferase
MEIDEPREGIRRGIIPGSRNVYFRDLMNEDGTLKSSKELGKVFHAKDIDTLKATSVYSGVGISASVVDLALRILGNHLTSVYVGSWTEYASQEEPELNSGYWNMPGKLVDRTF